MELEKQLQLEWEKLEESLNEGIGPDKKTVSLKPFSGYDNNKMQFKPSSNSLGTPPKDAPKDPTPTQNLKRPTSGPLAFKPNVDAHPVQKLKREKRKLTEFGAGPAFVGGGGVETGGGIKDPKLCPHISPPPFTESIERCLELINKIKK